MKADGAAWEPQHFRWTNALGHECAMIGWARPIFVCAIAALLMSTSVSSGHARRALHTGHPVVILKGHQGAVNFLAFSANGSEIASGSDNGTVDVWEIGSLRLLHTFTATSQSPDHCIFSR